VGEAGRDLFDVVGDQAQHRRADVLGEVAQPPDELLAAG
jgi:hypothetical protein